MPVIKSLFISCIEPIYNAEYIMQAFCVNDIATVSKIILVPFTKKTGNFVRAYIDISYWHETEAAYDFIQSLHNINQETRFLYFDTNWWAVEINKNILISKNYKKYTTINPFIDKPVDIKTNIYGAQILSAINQDRDQDQDQYRDQDQEWREIEYMLQEVKLYQNYECEMCF